MEEKKKMEKDKKKKNDKKKCKRGNGEGLKNQGNVTRSDRVMYNDMI